MRVILSTKRMTTIVVAVVVAMACTACWAFDTPQNRVTPGKGIYVWFKQRATDNVLALNDGVNRGSESKTLSDMREWTKTDRFVAVLDDVCLPLRAACASDIFMGFFHSSEASDFASALNDVRGPANRRCLLGHWNPVSTNFHNWTWGSNTTACTLGSGYV